jgi:hypothetical protein
MLDRRTECDYELFFTFTKALYNCKLVNAVTRERLTAAGYNILSRFLKKERYVRQRYGIDFGINW